MRRRASCSGDEVEDKPGFTAPFIFIGVYFQADLNMQRLCKCAVSTGGCVF